MRVYILACCKFSMCRSNWYNASTFSVKIINVCVQDILNEYRGDASSLIQVHPV